MNTTRAVSWLLWFWWVYSIKNEENKLDIQQKQKLEQSQMLCIVWIGSKSRRYNMPKLNHFIKQWYNKSHIFQTKTTTKRKNKPSSIQQSFPASQSINEVASKLFSPFSPTQFMLASLSSKQTYLPDNTFKKLGRN